MTTERSGTEHGDRQYAWEAQRLIRAAPRIGVGSNESLADIERDLPERMTAVDEQAATVGQRALDTLECDPPCLWMVSIERTDPNSERNVVGLLPI